MKPIISDQTETEKPTEPNFEVVAAEEKVRREAIEARLKEKEAEWDRRMAAVESQRQPVVHQPVQEQPSPEQVAYELGMSAEEVAANPDEAFKKFENILNQRDSQYKEAIQRAGYVMNNLAQNNHETQVTSLKDRDFFDKAEPLIRAYYNENPREKVPGMGRTPDEVYNIVIGQNWKQWEKERQESSPPPDPNLSPPPLLQNNRPQAIESPLPLSKQSVLSESSSREKDIKLSEDEESIRQHYNTSFKTNISKAEWVAISSGKVLPKQSKGAADWQVHGAPGDARAAIDE